MELEVRRGNKFLMSHETQNYFSAIIHVKNKYLKNLLREANDHQNEPSILK